LKANASETIQWAADDLKKNAYDTKERVHKWMIKPPEPPPPPQAVRASYCYQVYQDILCYRQPMPGWEYRLVGYQGTGVLPPPPAFTEPLPSQQADAVMSPEERLAGVSPVFVEPLTEPQPDQPEAPAPGGPVPPPPDTLTPQL